MPEKTLALRVDVDTLRGTRRGVPNLVELFRRFGISASFFFSVGPDNMGRHLWRLLRPSFLWKMLRTKAVSLYGWDILLRGTFGPGPVIGELCGEIIADTAKAGHEVGLHAWDHHKWQTGIERMTPGEIRSDLEKGCALLGGILNRLPDSFAAPAWKVTPEALEVLEGFPFRYSANCRGTSVFRPVVGEGVLRYVEVPTTLPTYDEAVGVACGAEEYNDFLLEKIAADALNVLTVHAEVEGIAVLPVFEQFIRKARDRNIGFCPLGTTLEREAVVHCRIAREEIFGRQGWAAVQKNRAVGSFTDNT